MTDTRTEPRKEFLKTHGWQDAAITPLAADASFRRYFRLSLNGHPAMLMDSPPDKENLPAFLAIARHLTGMGFSAPDIYAEDIKTGFAILEDFGNSTYTRLLDAGEDTTPLYDMAVDVLMALHEHDEATRVEAPPYDRAVLLREAGLLPDWHLPARRGHATPDEVRASYIAAWNTIIDGLPPMSETIVLRDFHVDNLMRLDGRTGISACGLLDFQDALIGHPAYDLMSLLEDARRDLPQDMARAMRAKYETCIPAGDREAFDLWYHVLAAQRHAKVAGIFLRLCIRDDKDKYLRHIPRVMRLLESHLAHPALAPLATWLKTNMPDRLEALPGMDAQKLRAELVR